MTVKEAVDRADCLKPNAFPPKAKAAWLSELEGRLAAGVFLMAPAEIAQMRYTWKDDKNTILLVDAPYDDIYPLWLMARIDEANGEYNKYANSMAIYNEHYGTFVRWFAQLYDPAEGYIPEERRLRRHYGTL